MKLIKKLLLLIFLVIVASAVFAYMGILNFAADEPHSRAVTALIEFTRDRSITVRSEHLSVPELGSDEQLKSGAGNYAAMCMSCHLAPGMAGTELSKGLYPAPPPLEAIGASDPARAFWIIKHGVKASGMPAWGKSMDDKYIWNMVAFLQKLPDLDGAQFQALVDSSGGHEHGGGETKPHDHAGEESAVQAADESEVAEPDVRVHADGKLHDHGSAAEKPAAIPHDDTGSAPHSHAEPQTEKPAAVIDVPADAQAAVAAVEQFGAAIIAADFAKAGAVLDANVLILESGKAERSAEEYLGGHAKGDAAFLKAAKKTLLRRHAQKTGDVVLVTTESELQYQKDGAELTRASTESMLLKLVNGEWKIVHIHWSSKLKTPGDHH